MGLRLVQRHDHFGCPYTEVVGDDPVSLAEAGFTVIAVTLAEPLRRAFRAHLAACGCAERYGFGHCPEAMRLFRLQPDGDQIILA